MAEEPRPTCGQLWRSDSTRVCQATVLPGATECLAHATDRQRQDFLLALEGGVRPDIELRHLEVSPQLLAEMLPHLEHVPVDFRGATFTGLANFDGATFLGEADFDGATFLGEADFDARFMLRASFQRAEFAANANFRAAIFTKLARFSSAKFTAGAWFSRAEFKGGAHFNLVTITGGGSFDRAIFEGPARFSGAKFTGRAGFSMARFEQNAEFSTAVFAWDADFNDATFTGAADFAQATFGRYLDLSTRFELVKDATRKTAGVLHLTAPVFESTARIVLGRPLALNDVVLQAPLKVVAGGSEPTIVSLERATLEAPLTVGDGVGLGRCRLTGATGLDRLRIVATNPGWVYYRRRHVIADELHLRAAMGDKTAWSLAAAEQIELPDPPAGRLPAEAIAREAGQTEATYRQLRAALEASKAAPAAADFYYGEMEMRRLATKRLSVERALLLVYKATCGYGLRASRALVTYGSIMVAATALFRYRTRWLVQTANKVGGGEVNFRHWWEIFFKLVARSSVSFFSPIDTAGLRTVGVATLLALRFVGPAFLALAVLAVRARVQR